MMSPNTPPENDPNLATVIGPARLAYYTQVENFPVLADRKASFLLYACGLIVTVLTFFLPALSALIHHRWIALRIGVMVLLALLALLLILVACTGFWAFTVAALPMPDNLAFYRDIARRSRADYERDMRALTHAGAMRFVLHSNYSIARQSAAKFRVVGWTIRFMRAAILLWMLLLMIIAVMG